MGDNENKSRVYRGGVGFVGLLTIVFIVLKLIGVINWPWIMVLSPIWISLIMGIVIIVIVLIIMIMFGV